MLALRFMRLMALLFAAGVLLSCASPSGSSGGVCGDGQRSDTEQCDDGNLVSGDGCSSICTLDGRCGDGVMGSGEACDDGNLVSGDGCSSTCTLEAPTCGDGVMGAGEACDDGNMVDG